MTPTFQPVFHPSDVFCSLSPPLLHKLLGIWQEEFQVEKQEGQWKRPRESAGADSAQA